MNEQKFTERMQELKSKWDTKKSSFPKILVIIVILLLGIFYFIYNLKERDKKILGLMKENQELLQDNDRLDSLIYYNNVEIVKKSNEIQGLKDLEVDLQANVKTIENKIKKSIDIFDRPIPLKYIPFDKNKYLPPGYILGEKKYCFIHSCNTGDTYRLTHLLNKLSKFSIFDKIFINNIGIPLEIQVPENIEITQFSDNISLYEVPTINKLRDFAIKNNKSKILYLHTKGTGHPKDAQNINDWIEMMLYFLVERWPVAIHALGNHDTTGCNYHTTESCRAPPHFSGNFWWANSEYLGTLPDCGPNKFDAEFWLMQNNPKFKCLHDSGGMNHYFNVYPPENYR